MLTLHPPNRYPLARYALALYALTLFVSAFLLFWVQLFAAKLLLPLLGGSPAVWNTCMCFFQTLLLLGYGYAAVSTERLSLGWQTWLHRGVLLLPLPFFPVVLRGMEPPAAGSNPILWLLLALGISVGLPFFVVSTTAPLLQTWFSQTGHPASKDPYFLYAASNTGSLLGLLCYPSFLEPNFTLSQQGWLWSGGYGLFLLLCWGCTLGLANPEPSPIELVPALVVDPAAQSGPTARQQGQWILLAFVPSSLLLGVTTYITTDIAAIPLLWALPLAIYLLTFIVAFARRPQEATGKVLPLVALLSTALIFLLLLKVTHPALLILPLHLLGFGLLALVFHGELARTRPATAYLTRFYLCLSFGGVLGGWFNALIAPLVFVSLLEYPLLLLVSLLLLTTLDPNPSEKSSLRLAWPLCLGLSLGGLLMGVGNQAWLAHLPGTLVAVGVWGVASWLFAFKRFRLVLGCVFIILLSQFSVSSLGGILTTQRSFFGVYQVLRDPAGEYQTLLHGTTVHGQQSLNPNRQKEPLTYFTEAGPIGQVFASLPAQNQRVAVLGLGVGTLATYAQPGQDWTFYEIDPLVTQLALDERYFTFLAQTSIQPKLVSGDARQQIQTAPAKAYDLIIMDAFSSDAIPVHLVTQEALQLYLEKLTDTGLIVVNITNRHLDLAPVLAKLAESLDLVGLTQFDREVSDAEKANGKAASRWVVLARQPQALAKLSQDPRWQMLVAPADAPLWTDDFSNLWQIWRKN